MDAPPARRKVQLRAFACDGRPAAVTFFLSTLFGLGAFDVYPQTSFVTIRRMIEAHAPPMWAARLADAAASVELFLVQVDGAKCRLDDTQLSSNDTLTQLGLGGVDVVHVLCSITLPPPLSAAGIGRSGRLSLQTEQQPQRPSLHTSPHGSPDADRRLPSPSNAQRRQTPSTETSAVARVPADLIYVRVLGSIVPTAVRVVLQASPSAFLDGLFPQLNAKLMQLDAAPRDTPSSSTHAFYLFTVLGVGCGKPGRRLEPLERVGDVVEDGSNVLTVCIRAYAPPPRPAVSAEQQPNRARSCSTEQRPVGDLRRCFVASTTWDAEEGSGANEGPSDTQDHVRIPCNDNVAASGSRDGPTSGSDVADPPSLSAVHLRPSPTMVHVELDLPRVEAESDDDCDPTDSAVRRFPELPADPNAVNMLEDAFDLVTDDSASDDAERDALSVHVPRNALEWATPWNALPLSFLTCIGSDRPSLFVADHVAMPPSPTSDDAALSVSSFLETLRRSQFEDELLLAFDLTEELDAASYTVYAPHQPQITSAQLQSIMDVLAVEDDNASHSPTAEDSHAADCSALHGEWDLDDVETICAHDGPCIAAATDPLSFQEGARLPVLSPAVMMNQPVVAMHPASGLWPSFCGPQPSTPPLLHEPLPVSLISDRVTHSERQHAFFRQQALVPLMEEHRRLHQSRVVEAQHHQQVQFPPQRRNGDPRGVANASAWPRSSEDRGQGNLHLRRSVSPTRSSSIAQLPPIASSPQQVPTRRREHKASIQGHHRQLGTHRMNVVASIYVPPERTYPSGGERRQPRRLDELREGHAHPSTITMSSASRGSTIRSQMPMALPYHHPMLPTTSSGEGGDVFAFLSQTLRSIQNDDAAPGMTQTMMSASTVADANNAHLDLLRSSAVATYTQRLLQEHRDIAERANELARMLQASPPTSLLGGSQRLLDRSEM